MTIKGNEIARLRAENAELRAREVLAIEYGQRVQTALAAAAIIGTWNWHPLRDCFTVDENFARSFGVDPALVHRDLTLDQVLATVHPEDRPGLDAVIAETVARGGAYAHQYRVRRADGRYHWIEANGRVDFGPDGQPNSFPGILIDVVERCSFEAERDQSSATLRSRNDDLEQRVAERTREAEVARALAEAGSRAKSEFLASMSHEIRTPLNGVIGYADLLCEEPDLSSAARQHAERIRGAGSALLTVVNDVLDISKIEAGQVEIVARPFALDALLDAGLAIVRGSADLKGLAVNVALGPDLPAWVAGDHDRLRQVLLNLCNNAIKFTRAGWVGLSVGSISCEDGQARLRFCVSDTGVGVPADRHDRLFRRFSQADGSISRDFGGTGLGLAISKSLVELMDGTIGFDSEEGVGSTFWFEVALPIAMPEVAPGAQVRSSVQRAGKRLLLVEDVPLNQDLARAVLERAGHSVDVVGDGAAAVAAVRTRRYDLVLMDVQMPILDGIAATRQVRALEGAAARVPIVAMTANVLPEQVEGFLAAGMDGHVGKPFRADALLDAIDRFGASRVLPSPDTLRIDRDVLDDMARVVGRERMDRLLALLADELARRFSPASVADRKRLAGHAHAMISATASLGFAELARMCREVEAACHAGDAYEPMLVDLHALATDAIAQIAEMRELHRPRAVRWSP